MRVVLLQREIACSCKQHSSVIIMASLAFVVFEDGSYLSVHLRMNLNLCPCQMMADADRPLAFSCSQSVEQWSQVES